MSDRTAIGGNNPPPEVAFSMEVDDLFNLLSNALAAGEIVTDEQEAAIDELKASFLSASQDADKARAEEKKPLDLAAKAVQEKWKPVIDKATRGKLECIAALTPYRAAKQRAKDEAARIAREEVEWKQRAAMEAHKQADDLEGCFAAEEAMKQAAKLVAQANRIDRAPTGLRTYWEAEITDPRAALNYYLKHSPEAFRVLIQDLANHDARNARAPVPGVIFHERKKAA